MLTSYFGSCPQLGPALLTKMEAKDKSDRSLRLFTLIKRCGNCVSTNTVVNSRFLVMETDAYYLRMYDALLTIH